ncbi:MAG: 1-acyl-sn-glycerol-3-phosphate acyltransferase [Clostridiales bacterium]|jgi:1-acyl-sn-glycerol-3-phosphate acyltransferase|nr:1-acyl-sn-glycerol-3-phosphate acyltransferase [Clostridiales bacterium]
MNTAYFIYYIIAYPFVRLIFPCRFRGKENIPDEPVIVCANHSSLLDPVLIGLAFGPKRQLHFMAKAELFKIPVLSGFLRSIGAFPVVRGETDIGAVRTAMKHLKNGRQIMMFPEGTRVSESDSVAAKSGAVRIATKLKVPILPVYVSTDKRAFRMSKVVIGKSYMLEAPQSKDYVPLADELMKKIKVLESEN